ncbi:CBS domain-containing protein [Cognatazoarcus halotolerans]|uniref:CBS domain-containing protein n=1 Tax=Cognatazoarcus halotolerans TaxID=2686016 RepID=UPI0013588064|nr:CBS domain-containing protein [Cognatazoarcus halotolerans]MBX3680809.1 CBS domain-containing protein [Rhodocyclaceae bacterium]MCB1899670.1 CBS domain-containing protein [Rhodocyclaceae bacterium]MCP5308367.1 CBS domain-containing protein [Zoogloeaceae bacterium]
MPNRQVASIIENQVVTTAKSTDTVRSAAERMCERRIGAILVVDGEKLVGIFTERDALNRVIAANRDPDSTRLSEVMTADPQSIAPDAPFRNALHLMYENGYRHVPVTDNGRPLGMVSARDALGPDMLEFESDLKLRENITEILG